MKRHHLFSAAALALVMAATPGVVLATHADDTQETAMEDPFFVSSAELLYPATEVPTVAVLVSGSVPTPCHQPGWEVETGPDLIDLRIWSTQGTEGVCAAVMTPVQVAIPLGSDVAVGTEVLVDGASIGRVGEVGAVTALAGAGWSFGMCQGYCSADLQLDGDALALTGHGTDAAEPLYQNLGQLTPAGQQQLDAAIAALAGAELEPVYGCPDCADGGAATLRLGREGGISEHGMELGNPPVVLAGVYEVAWSLMGALETCVSSELVTVDPACTASPGAPGA